MCTLASESVWIVSLLHAMGKRQQGGERADRTVKSSRCMYSSETPPTISSFTRRPFLPQSHACLTPSFAFCPPLVLLVCNGAWWQMRSSDVQTEIQEDRAQIKKTEHIPHSLPPPPLTLSRCTVHGVALTVECVHTNMLSLFGV